MFVKLGGFKIHASLVLGFLALVFLLLYSQLRFAFLGILCLILLAVAVLADFLPFGDAAENAEKTEKARKGKTAGAGGSARGEGGGELKKLAIEILITLVAAVAAWFVLCFLLQTSSPLNVVTSCSMLPALQRGDFIVLQGGEIRAQEASVPFALADAFVSPVVLNAREQGKRYYLSYSTFLAADGGTGGSAESFVNFSFSNCVYVPLSGSDNATQNLEACASAANVNGVSFPAVGNGNDVVVYEANPAQYGLIIHRVLGKIKAADGTFFLTKGDNNEFADQQSGITLVPESAVKGRVIARIPLIGYLVNTLRY